MSSQLALVIEPYEYPIGQDPDSPPWTGYGCLTEDGAAETAAQAASQPVERSSASPQQETELEMRRRFDAGRQQGFEEGRKAEQEAQSARLRAEEERHREHRTGLILKFEAARDSYLQEVEHEVVELALAVAARILRREAQMDPLLLTGAVRVALGQLSNTTRVRLCVPLQEKGLWSEAIAHMPQLKLRPEVIAEKGLGTGDCRIETEIGSVDLGLRAQLGEIEHGFFDRTGAKRVPIATAAIDPIGSDTGTLR